MTQGAEEVMASVSANVCRVILKACRLSSEQQQQPVMKGSQIGDADYQVAIHLQRSTDFMHDPEDFLHVFNGLIAHDHIEGFTVERQWLTFQICTDDMDPLCLQYLYVGWERFDGKGIRRWADKARGLQICT